ncbi:MAG: hypothetical protein PHV63_00495 [Candidatus Daviesbacteria bacterium]|nr:hypothetical protein [Candidatus Daviesbacteria bacterium]
MPNIEAVELFNNPTAITLKPGEKFKTVSVPVSPEGIYIGNGRFRDPADKIFRIIGFDRTKDPEFWIGRAWVITT